MTTVFVVLGVYVVVLVGVFALIWRARGPRS